MRKQTICMGKNKGADQLRSNCEADQRLCFGYTDSTIPLLFKSEISSFQPVSVTVQPDLCRTCSKTTLHILMDMSMQHYDHKNLSMLTTCCVIGCQMSAIYARRNNGKPDPTLQPFRTGKASFISIYFHIITCRCAF